MNLAAGQIVLVEWRDALPKEPNKRRPAVVVLNMLGELTPLEETRAYKELVSKGQIMGEARGRQREAQRVLRLLQRRIGPVSKAHQGRIIAQPIDDLETLGEALLDFTDGADLTASG
jgi:predicted transposase YdaD